jgi:hypothetical protein
MILINLLPPEYRQKRRTPVKMLLGVAACAAINASLLAYLAWTAFGVSAEIKSELSILNDSMANLKPQIEYHEALSQENKLFDSREKTLADVTIKRVSWTEKVDQLIDLIHEGGTTEQEYLIWLDGLEANTEINDRKKSYGMVKAGGSSGSENFSALATFLDDVQASPLARDFIRAANPEVPTKTIDETLVPAVVWNFPFQLDLRSPEERAKAKGLLPQDAPEGPSGKPAKPSKKAPGNAQEKAQ